MTARTKSKVRELNRKFLRVPSTVCPRRCRIHPSAEVVPSRIVTLPPALDRESPDRDKIRVISGVLLSSCSFFVRPFHHVTDWMINSISVQAFIVASSGFVCKILPLIVGSLTSGIRLVKMSTAF